MNIYKRLLLGILLLLLAPLAQARPLVQEFFVTLPEDQVQKALKSLYTGIGAQMQTVISIVVTADNTYINYDHWEDGYEVDLENPIQSSTEVWGPFDKGHVVALRNPVDLPRNPSIVKYDGRDRFGASIAVVASRAEWATSPGPVLAGAAEMLAIRDYGTDFKMPVGQNMSAIGNSMFEFVDMLMVAAQDGTNCTYNGASVPTLNRGSNYQKGGGVLAGDRLTCDKPVEVHLISGDVGATYESRWFLVYPTARWSSDYYSPVGTSANNDIGYIFFYNPDASNAITVHYETLLGTGTLSVPANGTARFQMPVSSGGHFYTTGAQFYAVATLGATPTSNNVHDWGFLLVPKGALTTEAVAGWAPGDGNPTPSNDYSPLWVTVEQDTSVYVDYHGDGGSLTAPNGQAYDAVVPIKKLESKIIVASNHDNTGTRLFTTDGTLLSAAWGQNSATAVAGAPALDMGTAVLPFPVPSITKDAALVTTGTSCTAAGGSNDGNGVPAVGECLLYSITINNAGLTTLDAALVSDDLTTGTASAGLSYVTGSTYLNGSPVADGGGFPLAAPGFLIQDIPPGDTSTLTYLAKITQTGSWTNNVILNNPNVHGSHTAIVPPPTPATCTLSFTSTLNGATAPTYSVGDTVYLRLSNADLNQNPAAVETLSVVVKNPATGSKDTEAVLLTETGINTGVFVGSLPSSPSNGQTSNDGTLLFQQGDTIQASSTYPTCAATTASIAVPSETKSLYLTGPGQGLSRTQPTNGSATSSAIMGGGSSSTITVDGAATSGQASTSPLSFSHTTGSGANRLLIVGVSYECSGASCAANPPSNAVKFNGTSLTLIGRKFDTSHDVVVDIWRLFNPPASTSGTVEVTLGLNQDTVAGAITFAGVDQAQTLSLQSAIGTGTIPTISVTASVGYEILAVASWDNPTGSPSSANTSQWNLRSTANDSTSGGIRGAGSTAVGTGSALSMNWTSAASGDWAVAAITIKPATASGSLTTSFVQTSTMASALAIPAGGAISVEAYYNVSSGSMPANPDIDAKVQVQGGAVIANLTAIPTNSSGKLTWTGTTNAVTVAAGEKIELVITDNGTGATYTIQYDSTTAQSKIDLPTTTVITVDSLALYDAPYPGGSVVSTANNGQTLYARAQVSDPFGAYDITSVDLGIDGPGLSCDLDAVLGSGNVVHSTTTSKTYESVWATGTCQGNYVVTAVAHEGAEGTVTASGAAQVSLTNLDLGTPGIVQFIDNAGADKTSYTTSQQVCVKVNDLDQAGLSDPIKVYVTGSSSGGPLELTLAGSPANSGIFTGCFGSAGSSSPFVNGDMLTVSYTDPTDGSDVATDAALVTNGTVPSLLLSKTRVAPADGIAVVGEPVQYDISVTNPGATALTTINLTDTYSSTCYSFQSASLTPSTNNPGSLVFSVGPIAAGGTVKLSVTLTAKAACDTTAAQNSVSASGDASASATTATVTISAPRVTVTKTRTSAATATVGDTVTFDINVTNSGTTSITTLPVSDTYSTCLEFVSATPTETSAGGGTILWSDLGPLVTVSTTIHTSFKVVGACSSAQNTASVDFAVDSNGDRAVESSGSATVTTTAASISGQIIDDNGAAGGTAADGLKNGGEPGIAGVTVKVYRDSDGDGDLNTGTVTLVAVQTSGSNGYYQFLNLVPNAGSDRYVVVETDPTNYRSTNPASNQRTVNVAAVQDYSDQDFLDTQFADITGQVVNDNGAGNGTASNGVKDGSEPGISGVTVKLYADVNGDGVADGAALATQTTYSGGNYTFANVAPGRYIVIETDPPGATSTGDKDGTGPNSTGLNTIAVTLGGGINSTGNDFLDYVATAAVPDVYATVSAPSSVVAGGQVTTLLTFGNQGLANAEGVTYSVTLPLGLTGLSCVGATCDYDPGTGTLTLSGLPGILTPGQVAQLVVSYAAPGTGPLSVSTTIGTTTAGDPSDNNTDTASTVVSSSVVDVAVWLNAPASAVTGSTVSVPVNFTNLGGVTATGVSYSVTLPAGLADVTCTGSGISCSYAGTTVTITGLPESLEPGQIAGLVLSYTAPASGPVAVTATVSATGDSVPTGNNSASGSTAITAATAPDLISLVAPPASAAPGSQVTVPVSYRNLGPDAATVTLYDLDLTGAPVTEVEIRLNGTLCTYDSGTGALTDCGLPGTLGPGQAVDLILTYTAPASGTVTVSSNVTATGETNTANNASTGVTTVSGASVPDVYTTVDVPASVPAGGGITALVTFGNQGPVSAEGVTYAVTLAPGLSGVGCTGAACTYDSVTGVLTLTGLPTSLSSGQSVPILISYLAPASGVSSLSVQSNIATSTAGETPTNNNSASASTLVSGGVTADVTTWISAPPSASSGSTVTVTAGYTNLGAASATGVTYALTFTGSPSGVAVTYNGTACTYTSGTVTGCGLPTTLTPGQVVDLVATFTAPATGPVVSTSTVGAGNDSDTNNNTASASTAISGDTEADVTAAVAPPASAAAGSSVSVPFSFANLGPATAAGMGYGLTLTGGATSPVITHNGATCTYSAGVLSGCGLPTSLAPGETLNLLLTYTAPGSGTVGVTATASTTTTQSNSANDSATGSTAVLTTPTVDVYALVAAPATATGGGTVDVALTFGNQGSGGATGVAYSLLLPAGLSGVSCTDATCVYDSASGVVTLTFSSGSSTLASGATRTATLHYTAPAGAGVVPVVARVSATEDPGTAGNNSATGSTAISQSGPNVFDPPSGHKTVDTQGNPVFLWRMVWINNGNADANLVEVVDTLPSGTSYVAGSLVCDPQGGSSTQFCGYEAGQSRVRWRGTIAGDPGATNEADAQNEVVISFQTRLAAGVSYTENLAQAYWDENGDTNLAGNELVASVPTNGGAPVRGGIAVVPIPVASPVLLVLLGLVLLGLGAIRLRCLT